MLAVVLAMLSVRDHLQLRYAARLFPEEGGFGVHAYLHLYTGHLPEPGSQLVVADGAANLPEAHKPAAEPMVAERRPRRRQCERTARGYEAGERFAGCQCAQFQRVVFLTQGQCRTVTSHRHTAGGGAA